MPRDAAIVEIGSFCGQSINAISYILDTCQRDASVFACDRWVFDWDPVNGDHLGHSRISREDFQEFIKESYKSSVSLFSRKRLPYHIEVFSDEFFQLWEKGAAVTSLFGESVTLGGDIGFCFIDGNHAYDYAKRDFQNVDRFLKVGGFVLFDDSLDGSGWDVWQVAKEVEQMPGYELVMKNPNYMFRKVAPTPSR
jgi:hypothetical protein